jgi:hypothetical protein
MRLPPLLHQHDGRSVVDTTSIVIVKRLISGCGTTTSTMISYTRHSSAGGIVCKRLFFLSIMHKFSESFSYFNERYDATGRADLTVLQKCTAAMCQLAYVMVADAIDEYLKLGKSTALECLEYYCSSIIECFEDEFLHRPTVWIDNG